MRKIVYKDYEWAHETALRISDHIKKIVFKKKNCSVFLTGGRGAERVYFHLSEELKYIEGEICFYLGDERCVPENHRDSNYRMILANLFPNGINKCFKLYKIFDNSVSPEEAAKTYDNLIPVNPDLIILGLGDDGHIASLFPMYPWVNEYNKNVLVSFSPNNGHLRISISKKLIDNADEIIVLASGKNKSKVLSILTQDSLDISTIPASIVLRGLWLIDESANK
jgi:6-phosphogluconolactonase